MNAKTMKAVGSVFGAVALASGGATVALAAPVDAPEVPGVAEGALEGAAVEGGAAQAAAVSGTFAYDQAVVTPSETIAGVFAKAATALCGNVPQYGVVTTVGAIQVTLGGDVLTATVGDMVASDEAQSYTMGCTCTGNGPGGGAIANADVSGAGIASIIRMFAA